MRTKTRGTSDKELSARCPAIYLVLEVLELKVKLLFSCSFRFALAARRARCFVWCSFSL